MLLPLRLLLLLLLVAVLGSSRCGEDGAEEIHWRARTRAWILVDLDEDVHTVADGGGETPSASGGSDMPADFKILPQISPSSAAFPTFSRLPPRRRDLLRLLPDQAPCLEASGSFSPGARMEKFNDRIYEKYIALKKREQERTADFQKLYNEMMGWVKDLHKEKEELCQKLLEEQDELKKSQTDFLDQIRVLPMYGNAIHVLLAPVNIREKDQEIFRLNLLLAEKTDKSNSTTTGSPNRTPDITLEKSNSSSVCKEDTTVKQQGEEGRELVKKLLFPTAVALRRKLERSLECTQSHTFTTGIGTNESSSAHMFPMLLELLESLVCMKISLNKETEEFSVSVSHEASGYSFTLTWLEQRNQWSYKVSSLGNLEKVAWDWMNQEIRLTMPMCRMLFQRISDVIPKD
ncbi:hypothetical protein EJB05_53232, partial [Eragrostis curvula]